MALWTSSELVRGIDGASVADLVMRSTVGIWRREDAGPNGTGILVGRNGRIFIVSAAHVLDSAVDGGFVNFPVVSNKWGIKDLAARWPPALVPQDERHLGAPDIGAVEIDPTRLPDGLQKRILVRHAEAEPELAPPFAVVVAGFVFALRNMEPGRAGIALPIYMNEVSDLADEQHFYSHRLEDVDAQGRLVRRDPREDLHVVWDEAAFPSQSWALSVLPFAGGLSGAGAWVFEQMGEGTVNPRLLGIAWAHSERIGCIRLIPMSALMVFLDTAT